MRSAGAISVMSLVALLAVQHLAMACTCLWGGPFAKIALGQELVVSGEVLGYYRHSMEVKVLEVLKGKGGEKHDTHLGGQRCPLPTICARLSHWHAVALCGLCIARDHDERSVTLVLGQVLHQSLKASLCHINLR